MAYVSQYRLFSEKKERFFRKISRSDVVSKREVVKYLDLKKYGKKNHAFVLKHRLLIEQELNLLLSLIEKEKIEESNEDFWLYCYACALQLYQFYNTNAYDDYDKRALYYKKSLEIKDKLDRKKIPEAKILKPIQQIEADIKKILTEPVRLSTIRNGIGFSNIYRIHYNFCRFAIKQTVMMAAELQWIQKLDEILGKKTDVDSIVSVLNAPAPVFNVLSVGLFAGRFIINTGLLLKHVFLPNDEEKSVTRMKRFYRELYDRHCVMLNDFVWGVVNLLTNYNALFNISAQVAGFLTAGFLLFDVALLVYRYGLAEKEFDIKEAQYLFEKSSYQKQRDLAQSEHERKRYEYHIQLIDRQLILLNIDRKKTYASLQFNIAAAILLMSGFTVSLLVASPVAIAVLYLLCTVAIAMYLSADAYTDYKAKFLIFKQNELENKEDLGAYQAMLSARNQFILTMIKNTLVPLLVITAFAICWQAALVLTAAYIGYECLHGYWKKTAVTLPLKKEPEPEELGVLQPAF